MGRTNQRPLFLFGLVILAAMQTACASVLTVTSTNDAGPGSLREAMSQASGRGGIEIQIITAGIIQLKKALPEITSSSVVISGPGASTLTLRAGPGQNILSVSEQASAQVKGLTMTGGNAATGGGAIVNSGTLALSECVLANNHAVSAGGGLLNRGFLSLNACTFFSNSVVGVQGEYSSSTNTAGSGGPAYGGALCCERGSAWVTNCTFSANRVIGGNGGDNSVGGGGAAGTGFGGGIFVDTNSTLFFAINCTIANNVAEGGKGGESQGGWGAPAPDGYGFGGGYFSFREVTNATLINTVIARNQAARRYPDAYGEFVSCANLFGQADGVFNLTTNDLTGIPALLGHLTANGGPVPTHAIDYSSPARDAGTSLGAPQYDARGVIRPQGGGIDIGAFEIGNQSITFPTISPQTYGAAPVLLNASSSSQLPVSYRIAGPALISSSAPYSLQLTGTGMVCVIASQNGNELYWPAQNVTNTFLVSPALLRVSPPRDIQRTYGTTNPGLAGSLTGLVAGDDISATYQSTADTGSPVGIYCLYPTILDPNSRLTNYVVQTHLGVMIVTKAALPLRVKTPDMTRHYGEQNNFEAALVPENLLNNDRITFACETSATAASPVGSYPITPQLHDPDSRLINYNIETNSGTLTITKALLPLIAAAPDLTRRYGEMNRLAPGTLQNLLNDDPITVSYICLAERNTAPGTYDSTTPFSIVPVLCDPFARLGNYNVVLTNGTLTILPFAPPKCSIVTPTNGSVFIAGMRVTVSGELIDSDHVVSNFSLFQGTDLIGDRQDHSSTHSVDITNILAGNYELSACAMDQFGGKHVSEKVNYTVLDQIPMTIGTIDATSLEVLQTGLYQQDCWATNPTPQRLTGLRIEVKGLSSGVRLANATGATNGEYYILYRNPLLPGEVIKLRLTYYVPDGRKPAPVISGYLWNGSGAPHCLTGTLEKITRACPFTKGTFLLEFKTEANAKYYIQYSRDLARWQTIEPQIIGKGGSEQWLDQGPPATSCQPTADSQRFYRLLRSSEN